MRFFHYYIAMSRVNENERQADKETSDTNSLYTPEVGINPETDPKIKIAQRKSMRNKRK